MGDMMTFPATVEEFMEQYKMTDTEQVYSNGTEFVPIFRMQQWFDHVNQNGSSEVRNGRWVNTHSDSEFVQCSLCKYPVYAAWNVTNYCPNCGAKMKGDG